MSEFFLPKDLDKRISDAVDFFWNTRTGQQNRQQNIGNHDQGNRGAVTGGKQLDGFVNLVYETLLLNNVPEECIFLNTNLELPGFYRPSKKWDLLVVDNKKLIIAIEFKSQVGPSFGNNYNNRTEEAMGSALDLWTAYREDVFGTHRPWLGYFMVLEDCEESSHPVSVRSHHFPILKEYENTSYKDRYGIFCKKLLLENQYSAACFLTTNKKADNATYSFPQSELNCRQFLASMLGATVSQFLENGDSF